jgi:hypothetical protein
MKNSQFLQEWLNGKSIEVQLSDNVWCSIPGPENSTGASYHFDDRYTLRIKPTPSFVFFHTSKEFSVCTEDHSVNEIEICVFNYPEYEPSGPHIMLELNSSKEVIGSMVSNDSSVNKHFTKEL